MWQSVFGFISSTKVDADIWFNWIYLYHNLEFDLVRILNFSWKVDLYNSIQIIVIIFLYNILYDDYLCRNWYANEKMIFEEWKKIENKSLIVLSLFDLSDYSLIDIYNKIIFSVLKLFYFNSDAPFFFDISF